MLLFPSVQAEKQGRVPRWKSDGSTGVLQLCYKGGNFQLHGFKTGKRLQKLSSGTPPSDVNSPSGTLYLFSDLR